MYRPHALRHDTPLPYSPGTGSDVWAMISAASSGDLASIEALVTRDPSLVRCHYDYRSPLHFAVRENREDVVAFLAERTPNPVGLAAHDSLLEMARDRGHAPLEARLRATLATVHNISAAGEPLAAAIRAGNARTVHTLLDASPHLLHIGDLRGNLPIHWAVMTRQLPIIDLLVARGADIAARRPDGARPIHLSNGDYTFRGWRDVPAGVSAGPAEVLAHLRRHGATLDVGTAAFLGAKARVLALIDADPSLLNGPPEYVTYYPPSGSPLRNAAAGGHLTLVARLLERGADPNLPEEGIAPRGHALYSAVYRGHIEIARLLLEYGAHPNPPVESSADALSIAINRADAPMIELLASYGAARSVDILAYYGDLATAAAVFDADRGLANDPDALTNAAQQGHEAFVRLLLRRAPALATRVGTAASTRGLTEILFAHGMDPSHADWLGITPLHRFARDGNVEMATLFLDRGAEVHARDDELGSTPLAWAARYGRLEMVELLLAHGADATHPDDPAWATPIAWARRRGQLAVAERLSRQALTQDPTSARADDGPPRASR